MIERALRTIRGLAFGVFVVTLVVFGSLIIMANSNSNMMAMPTTMG